MRRGLDITDVRVRLVEGDSPKLRAFVSITLGGVFVVHDLKVIDGQQGLFVAMPSRRSARGTFRDIAHPIDQETRDQLTEIVLAEYRKALEAEG